MTPRRASRDHPGFWAAAAHRVSGVLLALFLPLHFLALGLALEGEAPLDRFLAFSELALVKVAEWGLVVLLTVHLAFGLRVLVLDFLPWRDARTRWIGWGAGGAFAVGVLFVISLV